ncbi:MAG TPA: DinB family protein [Bryobacteraceae bacterium]|nr:DinB family protein [Bryobacteraceae bacterium]
MNRYSKLIIAAAFTGCCSLVAQTGVSLVNEPKQAYDHVKNNILKAAEEMPEGDYSFKPTPEIRTFGQLVAHIADAQAHFCSAVDNTHMQVHASTRKSKADLIAALKESSDECDKAYDSLTEANASQVVGSGRMERTRLGMLYLNVAHDNEEYGYMSVYLRLKNLVPPSSAVHAMPVR